MAHYFDRYLENDHSVINIGWFERKGREQVSDIRDQKKNSISLKDINVNANFQFIQETSMSIFNFLII